MAKKIEYSTACWRHGRNTSGTARLTVMTSGLSMCRSGGATLRRAVMRSSAGTGAAGGSTAGAIVAASGRPTSTRTDSRGMVTNTLPSLCASETPMSGA